MGRMRRLLPVLLVIAAVAGCGGGSTATETVTERTTVTVITSAATSIPAPSKGPLAPGGYAPIAKALRDRLGYEPRVLVVALSPDHMFFRVVDAKKPGNVDDYDWRDGKFDPPTPFNASGYDLVKDPFPLETIRSDAPAAVARYIATVHLEGVGDNQQPYVLASWQSDNEGGRVVRLMTTISGTRHSVSLTFDTTGRLVDRTDS
jgi:hypothetical protein